MTIRNFETHTPQIHPDCYVDETALVSGEVEIGKDSSVWPMTVIRGDVNSITIGDRTNIQDGSVLHVTHESATQKGFALTIGDDVTVGHKAILHACTVGNRCLIGMGGIVLDGAMIDDETMVAAGSLVPPGKHLESGYLWVGSPVKQARPLSDKEKSFFKYSAEHYAKLKERTKNSQ